MLCDPAFHATFPNYIRSRYRELSKIWHPDKFKGEEEKAEAHQRGE